MSTQIASARTVIGHRPNQYLSFLKLPAEIRNIIYHYLLQNTDCSFQLERTKDGSLRKRTPRASLTPQILQTCRQIFDEAMPVLWGSNIWLLSVKRGSSLHLHSLWLRSENLQETVAWARGPQCIRKLHLFIFSEEATGDIIETRDGIKTRFQFALETLERVPEIDFLRLELQSSGRSTPPESWASDWFARSIDFTTGKVRPGCRRPRGRRGRILLALMYLLGQKPVKSVEVITNTTPEDTADTKAILLLRRSKVFAEDTHGPFGMPKQL